MKALETHLEGSVLVFLPGQKDIETAIRLFNKNDPKPDVFVPLPLYGSLPPEDQDKVLKFSSDVQMMIVFTTNVRETSLTIPSCKLVIDSEVEYDVSKQMKIMKLTFISRSSADQRKGRAGRVSEGRCIRLYNESVLTRTNITPEILRSSLDHIILKILLIKQDPLKFPFISPPDDKLCQSSVDLLCRLGCITSGKIITPTGKMFAALPFDPRYSYFITTLGKVSPRTRSCAIVIAAILSAEGNVFFIGRRSRAEEEEKRQNDAKVALSNLSSDYTSDLLMQYDAYLEWIQAGANV